MLKRKEKLTKQIDELSARIAEVAKKGRSTERLSARLSRRVEEKKVLKAKLKAKAD